MKNRILFLMSAGLLFNAPIIKTYFNAAQSKNIYPSSIRVCALQFPDTFDQTPSVAIFYKGVRLEVEKSKMSKKLTCSIAAEPHESEFYVLVTPKAPTPVTIEENTINYFKVSRDTKYICYRMWMNAEQIRNEERRKKEGNVAYSWSTEKITLDYNRIPLNTIMIIYNPAFIDKVKGGDAVNLPTVCLKGTAEEHSKYAINSLLAAPDINPFHSPESRDRVVQANLARKTIVVVTT